MSDHGTERRPPRRRAAPRPGRSPGRRRTRARAEDDRTSLEAVTAYGTFMIIVGLVAGVLPPPLNYAATGIGVVAALVYFRQRGAHGRGTRNRVIVLVLAIGIVLGVVVRPLYEYGWRAVTSGCDDPVELTVLVPADGALGFQSALGAFGGSYTEDNGCVRANVTAYAAPWPEVRKAMELGWEPAEDPSDPDYGFDPLKEVGPRPDLWIAESLDQVELVGPGLADSAGGGVLDLDRAERLGATPLVVAVPRSHLPDGFDASDQVRAESAAEVIERLRGEGVPVLRSDPTLSYTALAYLDALYPEGAEADPVATELENRLARSVEEAGLALPGTDTDLLCAVAGLGAEPEVAVLTTERGLARYDSGAPLGDGCALQGDARTGLVPLYLSGLGSLEYQAVPLAWDDPWAGRRSGAAEAAVDWMRGSDWQPESIGLRGDDYDGESIEGAVDFVPGFAATAEMVEADDHDRLLAAYSANRVPTGVLLAIDGSRSMGTRIDGEGRTRFALAVEGVRSALGYLGPRDAVGLWTFPAEGSDTHAEPLPIATGRSADDVAAVDPATYPLVQGVDLYGTIVEGIDALDAADDPEDEVDPIEAMVVLTDGADPDDSGVTAADVSARIADSTASVYVVAVGDASCRAAHFTEMTADPRVTCLEAEEDRIEAVFDRLFEQLWS